MPDPAGADLLVRGVAAGVLLALAAGLAGRAPARITGAAFCLGGAAHVLTQSADERAALGWALDPVWALSVSGAGLFWAFVATLFGDGKGSLVGRLAPAGALLAVALAAEFVLVPVDRALWLVQNLAGAALFLHALTLIWTGWRGDLVEARRRLRGPVLGGAAVYGLGVVVSQAVQALSRPPTGVPPAGAWVVLGLSVVGAAVFLRADPRLFDPPRAPAPGKPEDAALLARLRRALDEEEVWREEGLGIATLATKLGVGEHHLRRAINEGLGYRNFPSLINQRRIAAAMVRLADPSSRTSISSIAYEVGFASLGPFNRAFRDATGKTPSVWRRAALDGRATQSLADFEIGETGRAPRGQ